MDGHVEQPLPPTLRGLSVARFFVDVRDESRVEDRFAVTHGIKPAIEIEIRTVDFQTGQSGHALQGVSGRSNDLPGMGNGLSETLADGICPTAKRCAHGPLCQ